MLKFYDKELGCSIRVVGDYVCICTPVKVVEKREVRLIDGKEFVATTREVRATREPFVDFLYVRKDSAGEFYCDEDSSVSGGLHVGQVKKVIEELCQAVPFMENRERDS